MNSIISDIALDLGTFALDLEFEGGTSNDCGLTNIDGIAHKMQVCAGIIETTQFTCRRTRRVTPTCERLIASSFATSLTEFPSRMRIAKS